MAMILTDAGFDALVDAREVVRSWLRSLVGEAIFAPANRGIAMVAAAPYRRMDAARQAAAVSPQLPGDNLSLEDAESAALAPWEQRARIVALRGLSQARAGEYDQARETFRDAVTLDRSLDLRRLPAFWKLPRPAHDAAVAALYAAERHRDAAALRADLKTRFRPRVLPEKPLP
jgi:hypothetical protein